MSHNSPYKLHPQTQAIHQAVARSPFGETSEALYLNSGFCYETAQNAEDLFNDVTKGYMYSRFTNPTVKSFEQRLGLLEGAEAVLSTSSGMSAVFICFMSLLKKGDHIVANAIMFSSCRYILENILPQYGISCSFVEETHSENWLQCIQPNTKIIFTETPANPNIDITHIKSLANLAHAHNCLLIVDNAMASPVIQQPLLLGADIVIYSATKHIDGQGRCLGGAILGKKSYIDDILMPFYKHTGACLSPFNAWVLLKGLETLHIRVNSQSDNAFYIAKKLEKMPKISATRYPYLKSHPDYTIACEQMSNGGTMIGFCVGHTKQETYRFLDNLKLILISNNLGDTKSLMTHPSTTTHKTLSEEVKKNGGITDTLIRFSVGLEHKDDLLMDIENALKHV